MTLDGLGPRICIMGPSNSGKSTLATVVGRARNLTPIHLDQLYHQPHSDWQPRPEREFIGLHNNVILGERWVMDGNYSRCLPQRLKRATGFILLDISTANGLLRYLRRTLYEGRRFGGLEGDRDSVKWGMTRHIIFTTRKNRRRYVEMFEHVTLPKIKLMTSRRLAEFYRAEGLSR